MKIITVCATKGGVGKTTIAYNFGEWLANDGNNILFIDLDQQCNLSRLYFLENSTTNVSDIFTDEYKKSPIISIPNKKNIDIIPGSPELNILSSWIATKKNKGPMYLFLWLRNALEDGILKKYDYIILDCHNVYDDITINAIVVSDIIFSPITPSEFGYGAKFAFLKILDESRKEIIDFNTGESYIKAPLYFIANMIRHNTNSSREFLEITREDDDVVAYLPEREIFNRSTLEYTSLIEMADKNNLKYKSYVKVIKIINKEFQHMKEIVDNT